ncbi:MAG: TolC family protein [Deltaproteobacteria bacterium]|nr:TolC family protein [Deltaproteobacteria bacterium]
MIKGMERLRSVALIPAIVALLLAGVFANRSHAGANNVAPVSSNMPKVGAPSSAFGSVLAKPKNNQLEKRQIAPAKRNLRTNSSKRVEFGNKAKARTIKNNVGKSHPVSSIDMCFPTYRQNNSDPTLSLPQAIQFALARNLTMADSRLAVQEKEYQRREAYSDFFPSISLQYGATLDRYWSLLNIMGLYGMQDSRYATGQEAYRRGTGQIPSTKAWYPYRIDPYRQFTGSVTITQPIFSGGKLINDYKYARLGVDYSSIQYEVNRQDLTLNVTQAYYQMMQAQKLLQVANSSIRALEALRNQTRIFYREGQVAEVDVLSTEGQLAQAKIQRTQALADIAKNQATLNYLLRNPQDTPVRIIEDVSYTSSGYRLPDAYAIAAANRLEIRQANISAEQALALVKSAKADLMPNVDVSLTGARYNDDWNVADPEGFNDWRIQGLLTWTFDMFRKRSTVAEKRTSHARTFVNRELLVETIMNEVRQAYEDMKRSESDIGDNRTAVQFRSENFRINQERYKEQVATYVEVLDAQRQLSLSQGDYYISLMGYKINRAILERKMGIVK